MFRFWSARAYSFIYFLMFLLHCYFFHHLTNQLSYLQAADTDISALVEIEKNSRHRFEFFMDLVGDQPICARTAWAYMKSGGRISHALSVYSCQLRQPNQVTSVL